MSMQRGINLKMTLGMGLIIFFASCGEPNEEQAIGHRESSLVSFPDINNHWAKKFIIALAQRNVIKGYPDGTFKPDRAVTRAEFASLIAGAFGPQPVRPEIAFSDVSQDFWAYPAIRAVVKGGFMSGYPDKTFRPQNLVTRTEIYVTLVNGLKLSSMYYPLRLLDYYLDVKNIPAWAAPTIAVATKQNLIANYPVPYRMNPTRGATRAEVSTAIYQGLVALGQANPIESEYFVVPHIGVGALEFYRTEQLGFSQDGKYALLAQTYIDSGAGIPEAEMTIAKVATNTCVPNGCRRTHFSEGTMETQESALNDLLTKTWSLRQSLGLTPLVAGEELPLTGFQSLNGSEQIAFFRAQSKNATFTVHLKQNQITNIPGSGCEWSSSHELTIEDGHYLVKLDSLNNYRACVYGYRIKGAYLAPDGKGLVVLVDLIKQGFECQEIQTMIQTVQFYQ